MSELPNCLTHLRTINLDELTADRRAAFDHLIETGFAVEAAEQAVKDRTRELHAAVDEANKARRKYPAKTQVDAARDWIRTQADLAAGRI